MKTNVLFIIAILIMTSVYAQRGVRIAYIDMEYILENVDEFQEANTQLNAKAAKWKTEIDRRKSTIEQMRKNLSAEKILLTEALIKEREEDIQILEAEMIDYQQDRFGPKGDLMIQRNLLAKPVQDQVFNAIQDIVKNKRYDFVFDKSADVVILYSDKRHDISDLVLRSINREKKKNAYKTRNTLNKKIIGNNTDKSSIPTAVIDEKKEAAVNTQEEKETILKENKNKKIAEREQRKKDYQARKKKLLEEKEAKRKAKLEERQKNKDNNQTL